MCKLEGGGGAEASECGRDGGSRSCRASGVATVLRGLGFILERPSTMDGGERAGVEGRRPRGRKLGRRGNCQSLKEDGCSERCRKCRPQAGPGVPIHVWGPCVCFRERSPQVGLLRGQHCGLQLHDAGSVIMVDRTSRPEGSTVGGMWPTGKQRWMSPDRLPGLARLGHHWSCGLTLCSERPLRVSTEPASRMLPWLPS